jgi:small subunit ribosomal protein S18
LIQEEMTTGEPPVQPEEGTAPPPAEQPQAAQDESASGDREVLAEGARPERPAGPPERGRRRFGRRKVCAFCVEHVAAIDYKDAGRLRRYLSDRARMEPRRKTGTCAKHQRWLAVALKRARHLALLPYTPEHIRLTGVFAGRR